MGRYGQLMTDFTLHLEEPDRPTKGRQAFVYPTSLAVWAVGPLTPAGEWSWALRYAVRDGVPIVTEQRVLPTEEGVDHKARPWEWSTDTGSVPGSGLAFTPIHNLSFKTIDNQVRQALANYDHPAWLGRLDDFPDEPPGYYLEWQEITARSGVDRRRTASPLRPGRPPLTGEHLAEVALHYTTALADGRRTTQYVEQQMQKGNEHLPVATWVKRARDEGFLSPTPTKGRPGGHLTDKAKAVIAEHGLESPKSGINEGGQK